jgi:TRAP-type mannitol/chloroaromatic compound transport system permease small subunit
MPSLTFVLPHWMYWSGLLFFPLLAMFIVRQERKRPGGGQTSLPAAYLLLIISGFVGLHRFYVRSLVGMIYIPIFLALLWGNVHTREARDGLSAANEAVMIADFDLKQAETAATENPDNAAQVSTKREAVDKAHQAQKAAEEYSVTWHRIPRYIASVLLLLMIIDAFLLPRLVQRCRAQESRGPPVEAPPDWMDAQSEIDRDPSIAMHTRVTNFIDKLSGFSGQFVALWSVIAVFVYYYEVISRYVFNSPTNWAHESMFLMFGMQYLLSGAYALREGSHVRVDVVYALLPDRAKAIVDVISSLFFFIFTIALLWTGWTFASDAISVWEVSFTEWAIQYWPVKLAIPIGAALITLQGIAHLIKDILVVAGKGELRGT